MDISEKHKQLKDILRKLGRVIIAYSGGVDSSFLLKAAVDTLTNKNVLACIDTGPSLAKSQYEDAIKTAGNIGVELIEIQANEINDKAYSANRADRCFHCKSHLFKEIRKIAEENNFKHILCGSNYDDKNDYRPGNKAAQLCGIDSPLMDAKLTKQDIRQLSRQLNLATADKPASPCLASRVSYGLEITEQRLKQIEQAEDFLRGLGLVEFRLRHHDRLARIEVESSDIQRIVAEPTRQVIVDKLRSLGFDFITLDLQGFKSGSMNVMLSEQDKKC